MPQDYSEVPEVDTYLAVAHNYKYSLQNSCKAYMGGWLHNLVSLVNSKLCEYSKAKHRLKFPVKELVYRLQSR